MRIAFTGHRDSTADPMELDAAIPPEASVFVHGGAIGFDSQVSALARLRGVSEEIHRPDFELHGRSAPIVRNRTILDRARLLIACYDERRTGGTAFTVRLARAKGLPIVIVAPSTYPLSAQRSLL